jgi:eukaryotic-like serine/threonine-protein kinase
MVVDTTMTPSIPGSGGIDPDLRPGQVVGEYQIESKLGQGGFGAVFKAVHPLIGKQVAIKVLSQRFSVDPEMVSRFVAEARAVNQIRHHNIIDIFSFGALDDGRHYYVMEYLEGETLERRITREGHLSLRDTLAILRPLARALDAAHRKGIAHRDLKAENVLLASNPDGVFPKLLDFGIAKLLAPEDGLAHKTRTGAPMGTPHYMSPEQCHGRDVDHRTDLYAFGVLVYVMLTGRYPLDGADYMTILMRQVHDEPEPASSHRPELPEGVDRAIAWLMRKDPAERPPTLLDAVRILEQVAGATPSEHARLATAETPASLPEMPAFVSERRAGASRRTGEPARAAALSGTGDHSTPRSERRSAATGRWVLAAGAGVAAIAVVAVIAVRSANREDTAAPRPADIATAAPVVADATLPDALSQAMPDAATPGAPDAAAPEARPADVFVTIAGVPPHTRVERGGKLIGTAPGRVQLPRSDAEVLLVLSADGFLPATLVVIPANHLTRSVTLTPRAATVRPRPPHAGSAAKPGGDEPTNELEQFPPPKP